MLDTYPSKSYKYHSLCKVCNARNLEGKLLRDDVDALIAKGERNRDVIKWLATQSITVTERNFSRHLSKHSSFARQGRSIESTKSLILQNEIREEEADVKDAIQRIINIGDHLVKTGQMPVTERLYTQALKEGNRADFSSMNMRELLMDLDRKRFEKPRPRPVIGEIIETD